MPAPPPQPRHRKNAAEWLMWFALQPVRWALLCRSGFRALPKPDGGDDER